jgi:hypothetical protein
MLKSVCRVWFVTYKSGFAMALRILVWDLCMMTMLGLLAQTPQFYSVAPYRIDCRFVDVDWWEFSFPVMQLITFVFKSVCFLFMAMCPFQFNLRSKCSPRSLKLSWIKWQKLKQTKQTPCTEKSLTVCNMYPTCFGTFGPSSRNYK